MANFSDAKTRFTAQDRVTKTFRNMKAAAIRFGRAAKRSFRDATVGAKRFQSVTKSILTAGAISRGLGLLSQGIGSVTRQFIDFDQATIGAASRFKDIGPDAADFEHQLSLIRDRAREAGAATEFTAAQSADALDFLARAGFKSAEAFGSLDSMINLATASGEEFDRVADISSDLLGSFGLNVDNTGQKIKNLSRLNDVLVKAVNSANVTIEDLFETMKIAGPIGTAMGQSLESVTAITAFLGGTGIKGSQAATALKNSLLNLASPSTKAAGMLKALGVQVADGDGNMRQLNDIIGDLAPELNKMGNVKAAQVLNEIFGKRAIAGAINIGKGTEAIIALQKELKNAGGTAQKTADRMRKSLGNRLITLGSAVTNFGFSVLEAFEVNGEKAITKFTEAVRKFDPEPIIQGIDFIVELFKSFWAVLKPFVPFMPWFIGMWVAYAAITKVLAIAQMITSFIALTTAIFTTGGAMGILNAIMTANPVGAIVVGIALLIAALVWLVKNFDIVKLGWQIMWDGMKKAFFLIVNIFAAVWGSVIRTILSGISNVAGFFGKELPGVDNAIAQIDAFQADINARIEGRVPPNQDEAAARNESGFKGRIDIAGAPEGSTASADSFGAADIDMGMLGGA